MAAPGTADTHPRLADAVMHCPTPGTRLHAHAAVAVMLTLGLSAAMAGGWPVSAPAGARTSSCWSAAPADLALLACGALAGVAGA
jgi:hypothetical protein